ncbi:MAG: nucleotidyltransferase family protein [Candidatus Neomarinimicrobiota bacterium]|jgi:molybdenum cofactor cytidylyltransferase|nr:nucleotidyltransferase family protein [Candidatus Neomarinimicrobiota bacterium]|tara:strand:+ start:223 stop:804 length:582 start_codon:yes stop_codon:yes gene_type:complete
MKIAGIILAAGGSTRMGGQNKLLQMVDGTSLVQKVVGSALNSNIESVYVILGYQAALIRQCISNKSVNWVENSDWSRGMASSIKSGIEALNTNYDGAMILLGDMPFIEPIMINQLLALYQKKKIVVPVKDGRQGNPVLFSSAFFADLKLLGGDKGAKPIIKKNPDSVIIANVLTDTIFHDLDTPDQIKERIGA